MSTMPQFKPYWWINVISWAFAIVTILAWYNQAIALPTALRAKLSRALIMFYFHTLLENTYDWSIKL